MSFQKIGARNLSRRAMLKWGAAAAAAPAAGVAALKAVPSSGSAQIPGGTPLALQMPFPELEEATIADLRGALDTRQLSVRELAEMYLARIEAIDQDGPRLNSIIEVNPEALSIAETLDAELGSTGARGPLHGIPVVIKDNIDTADQMLTTAGSLALVGSRPRQDAFVAQRLREAGAVLLGKTNLTEWANFRSIHSASGWSGRGGQCRNPYALDRSPCGSSSGSAAAVAASLAAASVGTETDGSIVCPSSACSVVGIKPTVGLTSRAGVIPIAHSQDTIGPHGRTVADAAALLGVMAGSDPRDPMTAEAANRAEADYTRFLDPNGLRGARIGVARASYFGYSEEADIIVNGAIEALRQLGAEIVDPADIPTATAMTEEPGEFEVLLYEFKADLNAYLAERGDPAMRSLADLIRFNEEHPAEEMPYFLQEIFLMAQEKGPLTDQVYLDALAKNHRLSRQEGIDAVMDQHRLDALVAPTGSPPWSIDVVNGDLFLGASSGPAALAGYPLITVPAGYVFGLPVGITFMGRAFSEPTLIKLAYAFEQGTRVRQAPRYLPSTSVPPAVLGGVRGAGLPAAGTPIAEATPLGATPVVEGTPSTDPGT
ncbi:MAG: amidase [Chloroflexota bacterium]|nr:amidase [Chloroflexota bacterium]